MVDPPLTDVARHLVVTLGLAVVESAVWQGGRRMRIAYPRAPDTEIARTEMAVAIERLLVDGWSGDPQFRCHGVALKKDGVRAVLRPQSVSVTTRNIELIVHHPDNSLPSRPPRPSAILAAQGGYRGEGGHHG
ncbi:MAG: hypothetical protein WCH82_07850 [Mycobacteriaceae bacterium]